MIPGNQRLNVAVSIQYDGTQFCGYELQPTGVSIRSEIEKALQTIFKKKIRIRASSRTDSGVHALAQIISFETEGNIPTKKIPFALNSVLPPQIRVIEAKEVGSSFNARYSVKNKTYEYLIYNDEVLPPFLLNFAWHLKPKLDLGQMKKAAKLFVGRHDFQSFCASNSDDTNFVRTISRIDIRYSKIEIWSGCKLSVVSCKLTGDGFLYKMVRNIVGTLAEIGLGRLTVSDVKKILLAKDRKLAGRCAPAQGLCLTNSQEISY